MIRAEYFLQGARIFHSRELIPNPVVSVILPTYCRGDNGLLKRAIDSILRQRFTDFELIVMDDGSTDGTSDLVSDYVRADDRVIHVRHDSNCGLPALRVNEGLLMARGEFCAYQFDDDQWTDTALSTLVGALQNNAAADVAYGLCRISENGNTHVLGGPFDYSRLLAGNYIANNSLIHRRSILERCGAYDMHLVMRRLCDWDLWLRWSRHTPFLFVDEVVSLVESALPESIGKTVPYDGFATRVHMASDRDSRLRPDTLASYVVDDLDHLRHLGEPRREALWRRHIAPYQCRFRHIWTRVRPKTERPLHVLVVKAHFDSTIDITISNFTDLLAGDFAFTFAPQAQIDEAGIRCTDILILHRTMDEHAEQLAQIARQLGKAVIFLMDDDLTCFHELAPEFSYLAPGTPCYISLQSLIGSADLVITYSRLMRESVHYLNPRNVLLATNIRRKWLAYGQTEVRQTAGTSMTKGGRIRIGFAGGAARREEFAVLWPAIVQCSRKLGASAEFEFWGFTPDGVEELRSPYRCEPFTFAYEEYLRRLTSTGFDVMIAPLLAEKRAKQAKCPIKFLEITAAGAVGVYSDVEPYFAVTDGITGFKCENTVEAWAATILKAANLSCSERQTLVANAVRAVERDYTSEVQAPRMAATLEAAVLHSLLPRVRNKPRIAYICHSPYLGGAENSLLRHAMLAMAFQFEPVLVLPSWASALPEEMQRRATAMDIAIAYLPLTVETEIDASRPLDQSAVAEIHRWLRLNGIAIVHSVVLMREVGEAARLAGIPHVASLYQTSSIGPGGVHHCDIVHSDSLLYANRWAEILDAPAMRIASFVPDEYFDAGESPEPRLTADGLTVGVFGTLQPRKGQLQAIEAVGLLKTQLGFEVRLRLFGYNHFYPDYLLACRQMAERYGIPESVEFPGFVADTAAAMRDIDLALCCSDWESLPQAILEAMAAGRLVVATDTGGIAEVISRRTGILLRDNSAASICAALVKALEFTAGEWRSRTSLAREVARAECSKYAVATELFRLYRKAVDICRARVETTRARAPETAALGAKGPSLSAGDVSASLEMLRSRLHELNGELGIAE